MVLVFSIFNLFINKNCHRRKLSLKKIPSCGNSALLQKLECVNRGRRCLTVFCFRAESLGLPVVLFSWEGTERLHVIDAFLLIWLFYPLVNHFDFVLAIQKLGLVETFVHLPISKIAGHFMQLLAIWTNKFLGLWHVLLKFRYSWMATKFTPSYTDL